MSDLPWVEKYRPKSIKHVAHQEGVKKMLETVVKTKNMPHCIFYGPPGTGKTSAALALCRQLFGQENMKRRVLELNASDDRGIAVVRDKIKAWTRLIASSISQEECKSVDWKVVILDEADMMTSDAQSALRRLMEDYAKTTRFIIICNYLPKIIDPIYSRCAKLRFEPISEAAQLEKLIYIAENENMNINLDALKKVLSICGGDLRMGITLLQTCATLKVSGCPIEESMIDEVAAIPPVEIAESIIEKPSISIVDRVFNEAWDVNQLMRQILQVLIHSEKISELSKARIASTLAEAQYRLSQGANTYLQMAYITATIEYEKRNQEI